MLNDLYFLISHPQDILKVNKLSNLTLPYLLQANIPLILRLDQIFKIDINKEALVTSKTYDNNITPIINTMSRPQGIMFLIGICCTRR